MDFINPINFGDYGPNQHFTTTYTLEMLADTAEATEIVSVNRYTFDGTDDTIATDISDVASIAKRVVTLTDFWLSTEDNHPSGTYRVNIVAKNKDDTAQDELNVFFRVP